MSENKKNSGYRASPETITELLRIGLEMGVHSGQRMIDMAVTEFIASRGERSHATMAAPQAQPAPRPQRHQEYHAMLDAILDHGEPKDVTGIKANLEWGSESVSRRAKAAGFRARKRVG